MEPRIATLLDQSPYRRFTLDPAVLDVPSPAATRPAEPGFAADEARSSRDHQSQVDHVASRSNPNSTALQAHSGAPISGVLNVTKAATGPKEDYEETQDTATTPGTEELAKARVTSHKSNEVEKGDADQAAASDVRPTESHETRLANEDGAHPAPATRTASQACPGKAPRKRKRWSQKETDDLLLGVSRFGIGRWKQILDCADFHFQGRTAVDLKDRFRVCRPGEGLKARKAITPDESAAASSNSSTEFNSQVTTATSIEQAADQEVSVAAHKTPVGAESPGPTSSAAPSKTIIYGPFLKSKRRTRREFSDTDDKNLLKGFKRHGPVWHLMRDDFELGFGMRHPTDLRDRFRIRYPELFAKAGYKLKPKEERELKARASESEAQEAQTTTHQAKNIGEKHASTKDVVAQSKSNNATPGAITTSSVTVSFTNSMTTAPTLQFDSLRPTLDTTIDLTFDDEDEDEDRSPIVLNRNILQWADENSLSLPPSTTAALNNHSYITGDTLHNPFTASDGLHINPLVTLKLPSTAHWNYMIPSTTAPPPSLPPPGPLKHPLPASAPATATSRTATDMRTPNLPNIVFPYVPNASARNAVHNLPPPADILSSGQAGSDGWLWIV
ncbi:hypothetical protein N0V94_001894 [Neodidymelliopsis sp. IMI 364377]|nr:hypothetical protein N0V94_001894 [Neodidymelliopsis sp. IMI 364377]